MNGDPLDELEEQAEEITRLREAIRRIAQQDATLSVCDGNVTVTMDGTLTDAEREAIEWAITTTSLRYDDPIGPIQRERLRGLLERAAP